VIGKVSVWPFKLVMLLVISYELQIYV
jgi:hypothetical protein